MNQVMAKQNLFVSGNQFFRLKRREWHWAFRNFRRRFFGESFVSWWNKYRTSAELPKELVQMVDSFVASSDYQKVTAFWHAINKKHITQIATVGLSNYRQTVAKNYFTFTDQSLDTPYTHNLIEKSKDSSTQVAISQILKKHDLFTLDESIQHNLTTVMLYDYVLSIGGADALNMLNESKIGNPPSIEIGGKKVSQDMLNSVIEFKSVSSGTKLGDSPRFMEVGAGSGRTAYCFLTLIPNAKYIIADVPPALFISQTFLTTQFPDKKIFRFRPFNTYAEIADEFESADIAFLMPHQLELINSSIDVFMAIDCLHEMNAPQVEFYFQQADRLAKNFYFKCWSSAEILFDDITWEQSDYPVRPKWKKAFWRMTTVPSHFFEALFHTR